MTTKDELRAELTRVADACYEHYYRRWDYRLFSWSQEYEADELRAALTDLSDDLDMADADYDDLEVETNAWQATYKAAQDDGDAARAEATQLHDACFFAEFMRTVAVARSELLLGQTTEAYEAGHARGVEKGLEAGRKLRRNR